MPIRINKKQENSLRLLDILKAEKDEKIGGGIYHKTIIDMTHNSNHIEGSHITHDETRYIFETSTLGDCRNIKVDDIVETVNSFHCLDYIIKNCQMK